MGAHTTRWNSTWIEKREFLDTGMITNHLYYVLRIEKVNLRLPHLIPNLLHQFTKKIYITSHEC